LSAVSSERFCTGTHALHGISSRQFTFIYDAKTWIDAQTYCREKYTDLATITDLEDVTILNNLANLSQMLYTQSSYVIVSFCLSAWIGLYDDRTSWRWSYRDGEAEFTSWGSNQPNEYRNFNYCVRMDEYGMWNDLDCENLYKVVCSDVKVFRCRLLSGQDASFVYIDVDMKWTAAQLYCRKHHTDLASARSPAENDGIRKLIPQGQFAWIGLFRSPWMWVDGRKGSLSYWSSNEPNSAKENCAAANFDPGYQGRWEDWLCTRKTAFVCFSVCGEAEAGEKLLDLNNSTLQEELLQQLKQKLIGVFVEADPDNETCRPRGPYLLVLLQAPDAGQKPPSDSDHLQLTTSKYRPIQACRTERLTATSKHLPDFKYRSTSLPADRWQQHGSWLKRHKFSLESKTEENMEFTSAVDPILLTSAKPFSLVTMFRLSTVTRSV
ncbi:hypothetical protein CCH79_00020665, partial [Gambusia affinis]